MSPVEYHPSDAVPDPTYFTVAEARKVKPLDNVTKYPDADIDEMRVAVEEALEHACGVAFVQRDAAFTMDGTGTTDLLLPSPRPMSVTACSVDGVALDAGELSALVLYRSGVVYRAAGWTAGRGNIEITVQHGYSTVPGRVKRAAILLTKRFLVDTPVNDRATSITSNEGITERLVTAGVHGNVTDVPEVNSIIAEYGVRGPLG